MYVTYFFIQIDFENAVSFDSLSNFWNDERAASKMSA